MKKTGMWGRNNFVRADICNFSNGWKGKKIRAGKLSKKRLLKIVEKTLTGI